MRILRFLLLLVCLPAFAQEAKPPALQLQISSFDATKYGYLFHVKLTNTSTRILYLPQSPSYPPQIVSLSVSQWLDGKTNMLAPGRAIADGRPPSPGYYDVGPCRDAIFEHHWIQLAPGAIFTDEIAAFDPGDGFISGACSWRHAHLGGTLNVTVSAFSSKRLNAKQWNAESAPLNLPIFQRTTPSPVK